MDAISAIILAVAGLIGVITATGWYLLNRLRRLESDTDEKRKADMRTLQEENRRLTQRLADAEDKLRRVPEMELQISTLTRQTADLQKRLDEALDRLDDRERELERLTEENATLRDTLKTKSADCATLAVKVETYENALRLVGSERAKPEPETSAQESEDTAPEKQEGTG